MIDQEPYKKEVDFTSIKSLEDYQSWLNFRVNFCKDLLDYYHRTNIHFTFPERRFQTSELTYAKNNLPKFQRHLKEVQTQIKWLQKKNSKNNN